MDGDGNAPRVQTKEEEGSLSKPLKSFTFTLEPMLRKDDPNNRSGSTVDQGDSNQGIFKFI
jgi:hypothetical protein